MAGGVGWGGVRCRGRRAAEEQRPTTRERKETKPTTRPDRSAQAHIHVQRTRCIPSVQTANTNQSANGPIPQICIHTRNTVRDTAQANQTEGACMCTCACGGDHEAAAQGGREGRQTRRGGLGSWVTHMAGGVGCRGPAGGRAAGEQRPTSRPTTRPDRSAHPRIHVQRTSCIPSVQTANTNQSANAPIPQTCTHTRTRATR